MGMDSSLPFDPPGIEARGCGARTSNSSGTLRLGMWILICMAHAPQYPGVTQSVAIGLATMMALDFLVMYFIDRVMKTPGLTIILNVLGSALVFVQAALAINMMLVALKSLGLIQS